jgi:hypothetical protein
MKTSHIHRIGVPLITIILFVSISCGEDDAVLSPLEELSNEAKSFLGLRKNTNNALAATGQSNTINKSFQETYGSYARVSGLSTEGQAGDTIIVEPSPFPDWESCATITHTENADGSTTTMTDYGDGCEEGYGDFRYFMHGKQSYTYKYEQFQNGAVFKNKFFSKSVSTNFGGRYYYEGDTSTWLSNGESSYSGESEYDSLDRTFSGFYTHSDNWQYQYGDVSYAYKSSGASIYDDKKSIVSANSYEYTDGTDYYKSVALSPLVMDYSCNPSFDQAIGNGIMPFMSTYVSGREKVQFKQGAAVGNFEIDYGNGECDHIITIYENGKVFKIDLAKDYLALANNGG